MTDSFFKPSQKAEYQKMNFYITVGIFIFLVIATVFLFSYLFSKGTDCQTSPIQFGVDAIAKETKQNVKCDCVIEDYRPGFKPRYYTIKSYE